MPVDLPTSNIYREEDGTSFELFVDGFKRNGPPPTHLVFLIHGIGYKMYEKTKFQENTFAMGSTAQEVLFSKFGDSKMRVFYLPITWAEELHALTTVDGRMSKITLPTIPGMRVITNDCLSDVLYYFTDFHRQQLLNIISEKMNTAYSEFMQVYPEFKGHTGILSHSLGGVISYDLLTVKEQIKELDDELYSVAFPRTKYPELKFKPSFLFALGSPIGAVMVMRGLRHEHFYLPDHVRFMNIFNPYDPLAYRIEPLIGEQYDGLEPVPIPTCNIKDNTSYLPNLTSLMPDRPNILRAAQSMLAKINLMEEPDKEIDSSDSDISCEECIIDLRQEDEDAVTTRRVSSLNVSAIGLSSFKRGSVVERLHELNSGTRARPSSFYQAAVNTIYSPKPTKPKNSRRSLPRRTSFPASSGGRLKHKYIPDVKVELSGNESDDEASTGEFLQVSSPWTPLEPSQMPTSPHSPRPQPLSRSKTLNNLELKEEMMWLWGAWVMA
ncbi:hypothetical protein DSO57_1010411 [Entomophthora muscae]|uniref:Uncharacterized protein n=1 Tax=Entomophthora muscae TaxID=34485 RepID=A0ACC2RLN1_9FUNG|nr:hypothetical protein DSO57_1010411 [Entomophthora muscae]